VKRLLGLLLPPGGWLVAFLLLPTLVVCLQAFSLEGLAQLNLATARLLAKSLLIASEVTAARKSLFFPWA